MSFDLDKYCCLLPVYGVALLAAKAFQCSLAWFPDYLIFSPNVDLATAARVGVYFIPLMPLHSFHFAQMKPRVPTRNVNKTLSTPLHSPSNNNIGFVATS